jgi:hypothetical protein
LERLQTIFVWGRFLFGGNMKFATDEEIWGVVKKFESCQFELAEFDHAHHLAVGMAYLSTAGFDEALERMRHSLRRFSGHHGKQGYHETMTRFWLMKLAEVEGESLWCRANEAISRFGDKNLIYKHYERERLMSEEARLEWIAPEL